MCLGAVFSGFDAVFDAGKGSSLVAKRLAATAAEPLPQSDENLLLNFRTTIDKLARGISRHRALKGVKIK